MYNLFKNEKKIATLHKAEYVRRKNYDEYDEINFFNHMGFVAFCSFPEVNSVDVLAIKNDSIDIEPRVVNSLQLIRDNINIKSFQQITLESLFKELLDTLHYSYRFDEKYDVHDQQFVVETDCYLESEFVSRFSFKTNIKTNLLGHFNLKDKLKKMISDEYNMRLFCHQKGNLEKLSRFIRFFQAKTGTRLGNSFNKVHYCNLRAFCKNINHDILEEEIDKIHYSSPNSSERKKIETNFEALQNSSKHGHGNLIYNGISIAPNNTRSYITVNVLGTKMKLNESSLHIAEALIKMIGRMDSYNADLDRIKLLYC